MDIISFSEAATANGRIEKVNANPDSNSGVLTQPMVIEAGESVTIPAGRIAVLPNAVVNGEIVVNGELFIPSGATSSGIDAQLTLKAPLASPTFTGTPTVNGTPVSLFGNGFKNYIIDGRFDFWYEGTSQTTGGYGSDTMWFNGNVGSTKTHTRQAFPVGETFPDGNLMPMYYSRTVVDSVAGAGNHVYRDTRLEDVTRLAGKTVTFSFYARADANKNIAIEYRQFFGTGGSPSSPTSAIGTQKIALTAEWVRYSRTFTIPSIASKVIGTDGVHTSFSLMRFWFDVGSDFSARTDSLGQQSGTFDIAMVQLEEGSAATDFEWNGTAVEERRVNRYAVDIGNNKLYGFIGNGFGYNSTGFTVTVGLSEELRDIPSIANVLTASQFEMETGGERIQLTSIALSGSATTSSKRVGLWCTVDSGVTTKAALVLRNNNSSTNKIILSARL